MRNDYPDGFATTRSADAFDNGTPRGVASALPGHTVEEARLHGWDILRNGELLDAEAAGFDVFLTTDRNIRDQQNLRGRQIALAEDDDPRLTETPANRP